MKVSRFLLVIMIALMTFVLSVQAQYVTQGADQNQVNWTTQTIRARGYGAANPNLPTSAARANAIRAAKLDALRNILEVVKGVAINSETTVENSMVQSDVIRSRVEGIAKGFTIVDGPRYMSDGSVEIVVEMPLTGQFADAILPSNFGGGQLMTGGQLLCPTCGQPWPQGKPVPPGVQLRRVGGATPAAANAVYTGLIIDCRGLGVRPAMAPKVVDENGNEVYGSKFVSREWAVQYGMVGYEKDLNRARQNDRVASNPLIIKGLRASGQNKTDVVVSAADAALIHQAAANQNFLDKCKVMFIVN